LKLEKVTLLKSTQKAQLLRLLRRFQKDLWLRFLLFS